MKRICLLAALALLSACSPQDDGVYTLSRNSIVDPNMRLHVATFDSVDGDSYNSENCRVAAGLFQAQPAVKTRFWCEKGRFKK